jgi:hypothetical protein
MICNKRKATNKSTKIKTTSRSQDEKGKPLLFGWDKPPHTKEGFTFSPPPHGRIIIIKNPRK